MAVTELLCDLLSSNAEWEQYYHTEYFEDKNIWLTWRDLEKEKKNTMQVMLTVILCKHFCVSDNITCIIAFRYYLHHFIEKEG